MSSSTTTNPKPSTNQSVNPSSLTNNESKSLSTLDTLGEDDEFEDFPIENWTEDKSDISHLIMNSKSNKTLNQSTTMEDLWEDNWDDEVLESDFAHQLRAELEKTKTTASGTGPTPMQT
ncbi:uncharacterized protein MELLADRAFT_72399 [Melampsora larici-populina 98AG31]|uniref:26S proteasome complex subunit SEM1 n=1 Tax=Melampsora larici-populina (strain 98AG31 / pathotype 3-4-7) TaxID=747676 RepID=F4RT74_MELLP|nr:uncharacterized protein MELLADRAFT_72399 [Melampsora larici-populina 98AG31]EGG04482.1 hypothetical protein MELLADRAFT_72399 [Melampsora larici-populina 98AG31]